MQWYAFNIFLTFYFISEEAKIQYNCLYKNYLHARIEYVINSTIAKLTSKIKKTRYSEQLKQVLIMISI